MPDASTFGGRGAVAPGERDRLRKNLPISRCDGPGGRPWAFAIRGLAVDALHDAFGTRVA